MEKELEALTAQLKSAADDVKRQAEKAEAEMKRLGDLSLETKTAADAALVKQNEIGARMTEIEQKLVRAVDRPAVAKSFAERLTDHADFKSYVAKGGQARVVVNVKAIISSLVTDADGSAGDLVAPMRLPGINSIPNRRMTIRDLLMPGRTASGVIQFMKETGFINRAATVAETTGATKPVSDIKFDIVTTVVTTIASLMYATKQILDDVPQLQSYLDGRMRNGLMLEEERGLLNGIGTGTELNGVYTQATAYVAPGVPSSTVIMNKVDVLRLAILQASLAEYPASGIVVHPFDWADIELTKTADGAYLFANPQNGNAIATLWRLPVVETQAMVVDKFLVGAFSMGAQIFDRQDATVEISTEDNTNFRQNLITIRAEERLALAVYRPEAFIKGDFSDALAL